MNSVFFLFFSFFYLYTYSLVKMSVLWVRGRKRYFSFPPLDIFYFYFFWANYTLVIFLTGICFYYLDFKLFMINILISFDYLTKLAGKYWNYIFGWGKFFDPLPGRERVKCRALKFWTDYKFVFLQTLSLFYFYFFITVNTLVDRFIIRNVLGIV